MALPCNAVFQKLFSVIAADAGTASVAPSSGPTPADTSAAAAASAVASAAASASAEIIERQGRGAKPRHGLGFKGELLKSTKAAGPVPNQDVQDMYDMHDMQGGRNVPHEEQRSKGLAQRLSHLMQHCQHALDASLDVGARIKSFQRMMAGMHFMEKEGDFAGSHRRRRSLIDELWEQVDDDWGNVQLLYPLIATLPVLPKREAMIALRLIRSLLKRAPGPMKTDVCTDLAGQIEPLYAQHLDGQVEQARYKDRFPSLGQGRPANAEVPCGMAAEILVRAIKTHPRNTLSDRLFAAGLDAARAQADYYLRTSQGQPRAIARKADIRAALFERGSEEQRFMIDEAARASTAGRGGV